MHPNCMHMHTSSMRKYAYACKQYVHTCTPENPNLEKSRTETQKTKNLTP